MVEAMVQMEEEEDHIVREMDVYLSSSSASEYHLLQYPGHFQKNPLPPQAVRIKPRHHLLEAEHTTTTHSASTRVYQSQTIPIPTHLCLGRVDDATTKLHLIPISQISQMRPTFHHLMTNDDDDAEDHEALDEADPRGLDARNRQESITDADVLPLVPSSSTIAFHRKESDRAVAARKSSYAHQQASQESEAWMPLRVVVDHRTAEGTTLPQHLSSAAASFRPRTQYRTSLNYMKTTTKEDAPLPDENGMVPKLWQVLQSGGPVPLSILPMAAAPDSSSAMTEASPSSLFWEALNVLAVVVRGNWYLHSKYLRRPAAMQRLRTFSLLLLQDYGRIDRSALQAVVDATMSDDRMVLSVLRPLAQPSSARHSWVPKLADDLTFAHNHPSMALLHEAYWQKQRVRLAKEWQLYSEHLLPK